MAPSIKLHMPIAMGNSANLLLFIIAATLFLITHATQLQPAGGCISRERDALLAFKQGITGDPSGVLASWQEDQQDCCRWRGVRCSNRTGQVLELHLGHTPTEFDEFGLYNGTGLVGQISHSLLSLEHLRHLDLSMNSLEGPARRVPEFLGSFKSLRYLNLSGIPFSGMLPPQLGNLSKLQYLDLCNIVVYNKRTMFMPVIPPMHSRDLTWLAQLPLLQYLNLNSVNLSTVVGWPQVVNMIPSLRVLYLSSCSLHSANQFLPSVNLTKLERLDLSGNYFNHPFESSWFWNVTSLTYLNLRSSGLYGQFPNALGDMTSLQVLDLSHVHNGGMMTTNLKNLCNLRVLKLRMSLSHGNISELLEMLPQCSSNKLQELYLGSNNITGNLPNRMARFRSLVILDLFNNHLTGSVPSEIGMLTNLTHLDLGHNDLNDFVTEEHLATLESLKTIDLSQNSLNIVVGTEWRPPFRLEYARFASCKMGPRFPSWLQDQVDVISLDISSAGIIDRLPDWFCTTFSKATDLNISNNGISGGLPTNMGVMSLDALYLSSNQLIGQIPPLPKNLTHLDISNNSLSGPLPANFGASQLENLILSNNHIAGSIPGSICELQNIIHLDLAYNLFEGEFPRCFGMRNMVVLLSNNNSFSGKFPSFLQGCTSLAYLDLAWNKFSGRLPTWIGDLVKLKFLRLSHNMFSGSIPINITNLRQLDHLNLADNRISGAVPLHLSNLTAMTKKQSRGGYIDGAECILSAITKGQERYYGVQIMYMVSIDLSSNFISGGIPEEITSLDALLNLNLSQNCLSGKIPYKIGAMQSLESLDLSKNNFSGEIPQSMSNLTYLSFLVLSDNNLVGRIPSGRQLDTLYTGNPSMYDGNNGLCGPPLQKKCPSNDTSKQGYLRIDEHGSDRVFFYYGLGSGGVLGLWVVFCTLLFKKTWKIAYFRLFDKLCDKVYAIVVITWANLVGKGTEI